MTNLRTSAREATVNTANSQNSAGFKANLVLTSHQFNFGPKDSLQGSRLKISEMKTVPA